MCECVSERKGEGLRMVVLIGKDVRGWIWSKASKMENIFIGLRDICGGKHNVSNCTSNGLNQRVFS